LNAAHQEGLTARTAILGSVRLLRSADEAIRLKETFTDLTIPDGLVSRLKTAGNEGAQLKEGIKICNELIKRIKVLNGLRGIHIIDAGNEKHILELMSAA